MALIGVPVIGQFVEGDRPATGVVTFTLAQRIIDPESQQILEPVPQEAALDVAGRFTATLWTISDFDTAYWVQEHIAGTRHRPAYLIPVRATDPTLVLSDLTPSDSTVPVPPSPVATGVDGGSASFPDDDDDFDGGSAGSTFTETIDGGGA